MLQSTLADGGQPRRRVLVMTHHHGLRIAANEHVPGIGSLLASGATACCPFYWIYVHGDYISVCLPSACRCLQISHPNIVQTYKHCTRHMGQATDADNEGRNVLETWMVMEFCNKVPGRVGGSWIRAGISGMSTGGRGGSDTRGIWARRR